MTTLADRTIAVLRASHDGSPPWSRSHRRAALEPSGASEWSLAQVLSHLGSGAEIGLAKLGRPSPPTRPGTGLQPERVGPLERDEPTRTGHGVRRAQRSAGRCVRGARPARGAALFDFGFLPEPLPLAAVAGMRLNESTLTSLGRARRARRGRGRPRGRGPAVLLEHLAGDLGFMTGFTGKADALAEPAVVDIEGSGYGLVVTDKVAVRHRARRPDRDVHRPAGGRDPPGRRPPAPGQHAREGEGHGRGEPGRPAPGVSRLLRQAGGNTRHVVSAVGQHRAERLDDEPVVVLLRQPRDSVTVPTTPTSRTMIGKAPPWAAYSPGIDGLVGEEVGSADPVLGADVERAVPEPAHHPVLTFDPDVVVRCGARQGCMEELLVAAPDVDRHGEAVALRGTDQRASRVPTPSCSRRSRIGVPPRGGAMSRAPDSRRSSVHAIGIPGTRACSDPRCDSH